MPTIQLQFRRGTAAQWNGTNPTLASGEMGIETDTSRFKIGNGSNLWTDLSYGGIQGPPGAVSNLQSGSVSAPSLAFLSDASAGLYLPSSGNVGFATAGVQRMVLGSNVVIPTPMRARIITSNLSGTSATVDFTSTDGTYYYITNTGFNGLTLTFPGSNNAIGSFNVFRNTTASNLSVTLTYSGGGSGVSTPLTINASNSATIVWNGSTYLLF